MDSAICRAPLVSSGHHWYLQDTAVSPGHHRHPQDTVSPGHHWYPQDTAVSPGYRRYPQDTVSQDTAVSWGHRILRTPPRVLGHGVPRIPPPVLGISRYPQDAPRVPRRQLAFSDDVHNHQKNSGNFHTIPRIFLVALTSLAWDTYVHASRRRSIVGGV